MPDYKQMYLELFQSITSATKLLQDAQLNAENLYIETAEENENKECVK